MSNIFLSEEPLMEGLDGNHRTQHGCACLLRCKGRMWRARVSASDEIDMPAKYRR